MHAHSSASDGTESPAQLVQQAQEADLDIVAITDHDTFAGWEEARAKADESGMGLIPGVEMSTQHEGKSIHIVSYLPDPHDVALNAELETIRKARKSRAKVIVENLSADFDISWYEVEKHTPEGAVVGRPHIADTLVTLGYAADRSRAFHEILHPKFGYTIPLYAPSPIHGIELIRAAGGVPVLAHPATNRHGHVIPERYLLELLDAGLFGLEIDHPENLPEGKRKLLTLAKKHNIPITGSSDWHGFGKENRFGDGLTERAVLEEILGQGHEKFAVLNSHLA